MYLQEFRPWLFEFSLYKLLCLVQACTSLYNLVQACTILYKLVQSCTRPKKFFVDLLMMLPMRKSRMPLVVSRTSACTVEILHHVVLVIRLRYDANLSNVSPECRSGAPVGAPVDPMSTRAHIHTSLHHSFLSDSLT
jgi:hypothetical protein